MREIKTLGKLVHPNIVKAHDAGEDGGRYFLVTEYVEGMDLAELVHRLGPLPVADAWKLPPGVSFHGETRIDESLAPAAGKR